MFQSKLDKQASCIVVIQVVGNFTVKLIIIDQISTKQDFTVFDLDKKECVITSEHLVGCIRKVQFVDCPERLCPVILHAFGILSRQNPRILRHIAFQFLPLRFPLF